MRTLTGTPPGDRATADRADTLLYLTGDDVRAACRFVDPVSAVRSALEAHARGATVLPPEAYLAWQSTDGGAARSLVLPGLVEQPVRAVGAKIINANVGNPDRGLPRAAGLTVLFDPETARPRTVMEGAHLSAVRTAAASLLAVQHLGPPRPRVLALLGSGRLARAHLDLFADRLPGLAQVRVFDIDRGRARALAAERAGPVPVTVTTDARSAVLGADIVVPVTTATDGYLPLAWLAPGAILVHVSLDDAEPDVVFGADLVVVDDWALVAADGRRLLGRMVHTGQLCGPDEVCPPGARRVDAELGDILLGRHPGRRRDNDIVLVNPFGLAIEDVAVAAEIERAATAAGLGRRLPR